METITEFMNNNSIGYSEFGRWCGKTKQTLYARDERGWMVEWLSDNALIFISPNGKKELVEVDRGTCAVD